MKHLIINGTDCGEYVEHEYSELTHCHSYFSATHCLCELDETEILWKEETETATILTIK